MFQTDSQISDYMSSDNKRALLTVEDYETDLHLRQSKRLKLCLNKAQKKPMPQLGKVQTGQFASNSSIKNDFMKSRNETNNKNKRKRTDKTSTIIASKKNCLGRDRYTLMDCDTGYPSRHIKGQPGPNDVFSVDIDDGFPIRIEDATNIAQVASLKNNQLLQNGYLKYSVFKYEDANPEWVIKYRNHSNGDLLDKAVLQIRVEEVYKMRPGLYYVLHHNYENSLKLLPSFGKRRLTLGDIDDYYNNLFGMPTVEAFVRNYFNIFEKLESNPQRKGRGLLLPYIHLDKKINLNNDIKRMGLDMEKVPSPLSEVYSDQFNNRKLFTGITAPMTYLGFTGSPLCSHIEDGPALASTTKVAFGKEKVWVVVPPKYFSRVQNKLLHTLDSLPLAHNDHLMRDKKDCILQHKHLYIGPLLLNEFQIPFKIVSQASGDIMVIGSKVIHSGMNTGLNGADSVNFCGSDFHINFNYSFTQCECPLKQQVHQDLEFEDSDYEEACNPPTQEIKLVHGSGRFKSKLEDIEKLMEKSQLMLINTLQQFKPMEIKPTKHGYKLNSTSNKNKCAFCGQVFSNGINRDNHENKRLCKIYGKCLLPDCKHKDIIFTKKEYNDYTGRKKSHFLSHSPSEQAEIIHREGIKNKEALQIIKLRKIEATKFTRYQTTLTAAQPSSKTDADTCCSSNQNQNLHQNEDGNLTNNVTFGGVIEPMSSKFGTIEAKLQEESPNQTSLPEDFAMDFISQEVVQKQPSTQQDIESVLSSYEDTKVQPSTLEKAARDVAPPEVTKLQIKNSSLEVTLADIISREDAVTDDTSHQDIAMTSISLDEPTVKNTSTDVTTKVTSISNTIMMDHSYAKIVDNYNYTSTSQNWNTGDCCTPVAEINSSPEELIEIVEETTVI